MSGSLVSEAIAAVVALAKEAPALTPVEAAAYAMGYCRGKEDECRQPPGPETDFYQVGVQGSTLPPLFPAYLNDARAAPTGHDSLLRSL
jgi:hypothetical protein